MLSAKFVSTQPDGRVLALARAGHEVAFEALVHRYRSGLLAYCRRLAPETAAAEDVVQQTFLQAWRALKSGAEVREVRPWLYRIAHNVSVSLARAHAPSQCVLEDLEGAADIAEGLELRMRAHRTLTDMAALPAPQRRAIVSSSLQGASHDEIANALGISTGSVRGLIYRARATLRSAAAAVVPTPVLTWVVRRLATPQAMSAPVIETAAGGGGAGLAAAVLKGGVVLSIVGAASIPGAIVASHSSARHRHQVQRAVHAPPARAARLRNPPAAVRDVAALPSFPAQPYAARSSRHGARAAVGPTHGGPPADSSGSRAGRGGPGPDGGSSAHSGSGDGSRTAGDGLTLTPSGGVSGPSASSGQRSSGGSGPSDGSGSSGRSGGSFTSGMNGRGGSSSDGSGSGGSGSSDPGATLASDGGTSGKTDGTSNGGGNSYGSLSGS